MTEPLSGPTDTRTPVVAYACGDAGQRRDQFAQCDELASRRGYRIIAFATDVEGECFGWADAHRMVRDGTAVQIIVATSGCVPEYLESATGSLTGPIAKAKQQMERRPRRLRWLRHGEVGT